MNTKAFLAAGVLAGMLATPSIVQAESFKEAVKDSMITAKVKAEMARDKTVSATTIKVETDAGGIVRLSGTAKSPEESSRAESLAKSVKGVTSVENQVKVQQSSK